MGQAIARALVSQKNPEKIIASDRKQSKVRGVIADADFKTLPAANVIIIAVKPQDIALLAHQARGKIGGNAILVSIAAGVPIKKLSGLFQHNKIVRVMPNLGLAVGQGIAAWKSSGLSATDKKKVKQVLNIITENFEVKNENLIDAVTAISGSGPAYFFFLAGALTSAGKKLGLTPAQSRLLVEKTLLASAVLQKGKGYAELIRMVRSKKGTTDAALKVFKKRFSEKIINQAVRAAYSRAKEMSNG